MFYLWEKVCDELFVEGEKRDELDFLFRDMFVFVYLKMCGWCLDFLVKRIFFWFNIDFEYGGDEIVIFFNNMGFLGEDFFIID